MIWITCLDICRWIGELGLIWIWFVIVVYGLCSVLLVLFVVWGCLFVLLFSCLLNSVVLIWLFLVRWLVIQMLFAFVIVLVVCLHWFLIYWLLFVLVSWIGTIAYCFCFTLGLIGWLIYGYVVLVGDVC